MKSYPLFKRIEKTESRFKLDTLKKYATTTKHGLYPHELEMLAIANKFKCKGNNKFSPYWTMFYKDLEPQKLLRELVAKKMLKIGGVKDSIDKLTVAKLKEIALNYGLKVTGKKEELIERILTNIDEKELTMHIKDLYFMQTEMGIQELNDNPYAVFLSQYHYMSIWTVNYLLNNVYRNDDFLKIIEDYIIENVNEHFNEYDFGLCRNAKLDLCQFYIACENFDRALNALCEVVNYDIDFGYQGNNQFQKDFSNDLSNLKKLLLESAKNDLNRFVRLNYEQQKRMVCIVPFAIKWFGVFAKKLALNETDLKTRIIENYDKLDHKVPLFNKYELADLVIAEIYKDEKKIEDLYVKVTKRLKQ